MEIEEYKNEIIKYLNENDNFDYTALNEYYQDIIANNGDNEFVREKMGVAKTYKYIENYDLNNKFNVFIYAIIIHNLIYSENEFPEFGGKLRTSDVFFLDTDVDILPANEANIEFNKYIAKGDYILDSLKNGDVNKYIEDITNLEIELIKLQPFQDGNKRCVKALTNLLLKYANLPSIFLTYEDNLEYKEALRQGFKGDNKPLLLFNYKQLIRAINLNEKLKNTQRIY